MHTHAQKIKDEGLGENSCCACRRAQQEQRHEEGERVSLPIPDSASSELQRKFAVFLYRCARVQTHMSRRSAV